MGFRLFYLKKKDMNSNFTTSGLIFLLSFFCFHSFGQIEDTIFPVSSGGVILKREIKEGVYDIVDEAAEYQGGYVALKKFLAENLVYSKAMTEGGYTGKYYVKFIVDKDGTCRDFTITRTTIECTECDKEVLRVLKLMPKWKPGLVNGESVSSWFRLPVTFDPK